MASAAGVSCDSRIKAFLKLKIKKVENKETTSTKIKIMNLKVLSHLHF